MEPVLSICIATFNRARFIAQTLDSIICQMPRSVELVIVDGGSTDETAKIVGGYAANQPSLKYFRESTNSGVDQDFDKAVNYASGRYCWLFSDDDLMRPDAIERVLLALGKEPQLLVVNSEVKTHDFGVTLVPRFIPIGHDKEYSSGSIDELMRDTGNGLSFIGAVVVERQTWLARDRAKYFGSLFVHVGAIFQEPVLRSVMLLSDPLVIIRYGNAMWSPRSFQIWMFMWPDLIWSFGHIDKRAREAVVRRHPWKKWAKLLLHRAVGSYGVGEYREYLESLRISPRERLGAVLIARCPEKLANIVASTYCLLFARGALCNIYDLARCRNASWVAKLLSSRLGLPI